jgi:hypothetical protein
VRGVCVAQSMDTINMSEWTKYTLIIACNLTDAQRLHIGAQLYASNIPLILCDSHGMTSCIRIVAQTHVIRQLHAANAAFDLRLDAPFERVLFVFIVIH